MSVIFPLFIAVHKAYIDIHMGSGQDFAYAAGKQHGLISLVVDGLTSIIHEI